MTKKFLCLAAFIGLTLTGCPDNTGPNPNPSTEPTTAPTGSTEPTATEPASGGAKTADVSHVKVGQKYTYDMNQGGMKMQMVYEVKEITPTAIKCSIQSIMDMGQGMAPVGDPNPFEYPLVAPDTTATPPPTTTAPAPEVSFEEVEAAGKKWRCMVTTSGNTKTFLFAPNDVPTFPGVIKMEMDGAVTQVLASVTE